MGGSLYIRIMLPELKDKIIACDVVREDQPILKRMKEQLQAVRWCYGVQFLGMADPKPASIEEADDIALGRKAVGA